MTDPADPAVTTLDDLERVLDGAALLGLELDTRYRVLAATFEPQDDHYPWGRGVGGVTVVDRRIQVLLSPVSTILASLRRTVPGTADPRTEIYTFGEDQLVDVVAAFGGAPVEPPLFGRAEPRPGSWAPQWSLEGRSTAGDGTTRTVTVSVRTVDADGSLALDLFARFDELLVKDPFGTDLLTLRPRGPLDLADGAG